jgi:hypothetical protein
MMCPQYIFANAARTILFVQGVKGSSAPKASTDDSVPNKQNIPPAMEMPPTVETYDHRLAGTATSKLQNELSLSSSEAA